MKIYTYYENINFNQQNCLIDLWKLSWIKHGFEPIVLNRIDAEKHPYYEKFILEISRVYTYLLNQPITKYVLACWLRWLAYALQPEEIFYVSDYDVINNSFAGAELKDNLQFYNMFCPCFASGTPTQFNVLCEAFVEVTNNRLEKIKEIHKQLNLRSYHDQDFLVTNFCTKNNKEGAKSLASKYNISFSVNPSLLNQPNININYKEQTQLIHFSRFSIRNFLEKDNLPYSNIDEKRLELIREIVQC